MEIPIFQGKLKEIDEYLKNNSSFLAEYFIIKHDNYEDYSPYSSNYFSWLKQFPATLNIALISPTRMNIRQSKKFEISKLDSLFDFEFFFGTNKDFYKQESGFTKFLIFQQNFDYVIFYNGIFWFFYESSFNQWIQDPYFLENCIISFHLQRDMNASNVIPYYITHDSKIETTNTAKFNSFISVMKNYYRLSVFITREYCTYQIILFSGLFNKSIKDSISK
ncbi:MAG: hypothetical protein SFU91_11425 [Chloroherpetonaceae bacterium]|nr:hypothetical protein [Chloroherpetonaceae bacterium]